MQSNDVISDIRADKSITVTAELDIEQYNEFEQMIIDLPVKRSSISFDIFRFSNSLGKIASFKFTSHADKRKLKQQDWIEIDPALVKGITRSEDLFGLYYADTAGVIFLYSTVRMLIFSNDEEILMHEINERNRRLGFLRNCPECGIEFIPSKEDQIYHDRKCADRVGARRRRAEKKLTSHQK